jgi:phage shock protein PspC (stress-responsive transcriptional regulator)
VVGGAARTWGFEPGLGRIILVVAAVVFPPVIAAYILAWALVPADPDPPVRLRDLARTRPRSTASTVVAIIVCLMLLGGGFGAAASANFVLAAGLVGVGCLLWRSTLGPAGPAPAGPGGAAPLTGGGGPGGPAGSGWGTPTPGWPPAAGGVSDPAPRPTVAGSESPPAPPEATAAPATAVAPVAAAATSHDTAPADARHVDAGASPVIAPAGSAWPPAGSAWPPAGSAWPPTDYRPAAPPAPPAPRRPLRRPPPPVTAVTAGLAVAALGLALAGQQLGLFDLSPSEGAAVLLAACGVGLLAGAVAGGGRLLLLPALVLAPAVLVADRIADLPWDGSSGSRTVRPLAAADIGDGYQHTAGELVVDLRDLDLNGTVVVPIDQAAGRIEVIVPSGVDIEATAEVGIGEAEVLGRSEFGPGVDVSATADAAGTTDRLVIRAELGAGEVLVRSGGSPDGAR